MDFSLTRSHPRTSARSRASFYRSILFAVFVAAGASGTLISSAMTSSAYAQVSATADTTGAGVVTSRILGAEKDWIRVESLKDLNSNAAEANCFIASDGSIYFTSTRDDGKNVVYTAKRKPSEGLDKASHWASPEKFLELPGKENVSSLSVAADGLTAVIGICNRNDAVMQSCDVYQAEMSPGKLDHFMALGVPMNTEWWDAQPAISADGQTLYFASDRKGGHGGEDIYMSHRSSDGHWSDPVNLSFNSSASDLAPFISLDGETLYFASNRKGGFGGYDIYVTHRRGENDWTEPKNLGPTINSARDELFYYVAPTGDELYFTSDREGLYHLYRVYLQPPPPKPHYAVLTGHLIDAESHQPVSTHPDIAITSGSDKIENTGTGSEYSVRVLAGTVLHVDAGAEAYVSNTLDWQAPATNDSRYAGDQTPTITQDIVLAPSHARVIGRVINAISHEPVAAKVTLERLAGDAPPMTVTADAKTGEFLFNVNPLITYKISASKQDFEPYPTSQEPVKIEIPAAREKMITVEKEINMTPTGIEHVLLFFDFNKFDLKDTESVKLEHFIQQVKLNPVVRIEVNGYTDTVGTQEKNLILSQHRAKTVVDYLIHQGVPRDQVATVQGFGKSAPLDPVDQAKNRRVEVRIVGKQD